MTLDMGPDHPLLLTPAEAALLLGVDVRRLRQWRETNAGPTFHELGKGLVRYSRASVTEQHQAPATGHASDLSPG